LHAIVPFIRQVATARASFTNISLRPAYSVGTFTFQVLCVRAHNSVDADTVRGLSRLNRGVLGGRIADGELPADTVAHPMNMSCDVLLTHVAHSQRGALVVRRVGCLCRCPRLVRIANSEIRTDSLRIGGCSIGLVFVKEVARLYSGTLAIGKFGRRSALILSRAAGSESATNTVGRSRRWRSLELSAAESDGI
jgi:hypothetical protein